MTSADERYSSFREDYKKLDSKLCFKYGLGQGDPPFSYTDPFDLENLDNLKEVTVASDDSDSEIDYLIETVAEAYQTQKQSPLLLKNQELAKEHTDPDHSGGDIFMQFMYGNRVAQSPSKPQKNETMFQRFLNSISIKSSRRKQHKHTHVGERDHDIGDEDAGIFRSEKKKATEKEWKGWWNIMRILLWIFILIDFLHSWYQHGQYQLTQAEEEFVHLQKLANCQKKASTSGVGEQIIEVMRAINAFLSFLVLFVKNEETSMICAYWIASRWIFILTRAARYFWLTRFLNQTDLVFELSWHFGLTCLFEGVGMFLISYFYYEFSGILTYRVNKLRNGRVLNLEIDAKHLDEFSQRKAAVRFAGTYQSTLLIRKQIKEAKARGNKWQLKDPKPEECKFALEEGVKAYKYYRGIKELKIEETGDKIKRKIQLREAKRLEENRKIDLKSFFSIHSNSSTGDSVRKASHIKNSTH